MSPPFGAGHFASWTGGCLFLGQHAQVIPEHSHYAIQIAFGSRPGIRVRANGAWAEYGGVMIPSRQPHSTDATGVGISAVLLIEPETPQGRALAKQLAHTSIAELPAHVLSTHVPAVFAAFAESGVGAALQQACEALIAALATDAELAMPVDARISRATAYINSHLHMPLTLDAVAEVTCLSPSRFRHLFVESTGMAFRSYVLWRRFVYVWELLARGSTLSRAAHAAGFADAAHLTRTSRTMFGFPPSALHVVHEPPAIPVRVVHTAARKPFVARPSTSAVTPRFTLQPLRSIPSGVMHAL